MSIIGFNFVEEVNNNNIILSLFGKDFKKKDCVICCESEVVVVFVLCGYNLFCMECVNCIKDENNFCLVC